MVASKIERSRLILANADWDSLDDAFSLKIPMDSPHENADLLKRLIQDGFATLHHLLLDGERIGLLVTRIDQGSEGRELVVVSVFSESKFPLTSAISQAIDAMAKKEECCSIRFHTARHGLAKIATDFFGFHVSEIILRKDVQK